MTEISFSSLESTEYQGPGLDTKDERIKFLEGQIVQKERKVTELQGLNHKLELQLKDAEKRIEDMNCAGDTLMVQSSQVHNVSMSDTTLLNTFHDESGDSIGYTPEFDPDLRKDFPFVPEIIERPELVKMDIDDCKASVKVVFDLETTGAGYRDQIVQVAAASMDAKNEFNCFVMPAVPFSEESSKTTGMQVRYLEGIRTLTVSGVSVSARHIRNVMHDFLIFLESFKAPIVLVGHNIHNFDMRFLVGTLKKLMMLDKFQSIVVGVCDTLVSARRLLPGLSSYSQVSLVEEQLGMIYEAHNALADVLSLIGLCQKLNTDEILGSSVTLDSQIKLLDYHALKNQKVYSFQALIDTQTLSKALAGRAAASGLTGFHLQKVFEEGGRDGLCRILREATKDCRPRVTVVDVIIDRLVLYYSNLK